MLNHRNEEAEEEREKAWQRLLDARWISFLYFLCVYYYVCVYSASVMSARRETKRERRRKGQNERGRSRGAVVYGRFRSDSDPTKRRPRLPWRGTYKPNAARGNMSAAETDAPRESVYTRARAERFHFPLKIFQQLREFRCEKLLRYATGGRERGGKGERREEEEKKREEGK